MKKYLAVALAATCVWLSMNLDAFSQATSLINRVQQYGVIDKNGATQVNTSGVNNSYGANAAALATASSATDIACITGSATKNIHVSQVSISGTSGTAVDVPVKVLFRQSIDTGGTAATTTALPVPYPYWSTNVAATAVTTSYTANPTIVDSTPGVLAIAVVGFPLTSTAGGAPIARFDFGARGGVGQPTLQGATQQICVNLSATTISTPAVNVGFEWTED